MRKVGKASGSKAGEVQLTDERFRREMEDLTGDLATLFEARYPAFFNAMKMLKEDELIDFMIEMCDIFDMYKSLTGDVARLYQEHRRSTGSLEDRDWPDN